MALAPDLEPLLPWLMAHEVPDLPTLRDRINRPAWMDRGACRRESLDAFFPSRGVSTATAKAVCADCVVKTPCLDYALSESDLAGVWGGTSPEERRQMRRDDRL